MRKIVITTAAIVLLVARGHAQPSANTFGYSVQGATIGTTMSNSVSATRYQMGSQDGTVASMSVFIASPVSAPPNNQFQLAIYADNSGVPGALIASSASQAIVPDAWNTVPISAPVTANAYYWLAYNTNGLAANANNLRYDAGVAPSMWINSQPFGTWPATYGPIGGTASYRQSIYGTFVPQPLIKGVLTILLQNQCSGTVTTSCVTGFQVTHVDPATGASVVDATVSTALPVPYTVSATGKDSTGVATTIAPASIMFNFKSTP